MLKVIRSKYMKLSNDMNAIWWCKEGKETQSAPRAEETPHNERARVFFLSVRMSPSIRVAQPTNEITSCFPVPSQLLIPIRILGILVRINNNMFIRETQLLFLKTGAY
jgi:hypothetical protein